MAAYDNTNRGIIAKNDRKTTDKHPDISGSLNVEGVEYFIDGWHKKRNDGGGTFYSLSIKQKNQQRGTGPDRQAPQPSRDLDDDLPF